MINIQARKITDNLASLVKQIDSLVDDAAKKGSDTKHAFVVLITEEPGAAEAKLADVAAKHGIQNTPLTIYEGASGPNGYRIAPDAEVTVMMWESQEVEVNHAFGPGELDAEAVKKVVADARQFLQ